MYKLHLILKYLLRRRIAWVSLVAVMLCTTMVVVVRSVMGGWLEMFKESFHGLSGDVIVEGHTLSGFPHYQEIIARVEALPEVEAAVPTIYTFGLINVANLKSDGVQVLGYPIEKISKIHGFDDSLFRQRRGRIDEADAKDVSPVRAELLRKMAALTPTFDLRTYVRVPLDALPAGVSIPPDADNPPASQPVDEETVAPVVRKHGLFYDPANRWLIFHGIMGDDERDQFASMSSDAVYREAIALLYEKTNDEVTDYQRAVPRSRSDVTKWPGMIAGVGVLEIKKNRRGETVGRHPGLFRYPTKLTVMDMQPGRGLSVDASTATPKSFWIIDDSRTGVWQYDSKTVYVPFEVLQGMLGMGEKVSTDKETGEKVLEPARATDIHIKVKDGVDLALAKTKIAVIVDEVFAKHRDDVAYYGADPTVETWLEDKATFIAAVENETVLVTFLVGMISIVAVFLIFCIFYMIVVEKTKDIGIIKSVGATAGGVAGIFLGYGLAIGIVGVAMGLGVSYLIVTNINLIHQKLAEVLKIQLWSPETYVFDTIPNRIDPREAAFIAACALVASVLGAVLPAVRAGRMDPVDSLRWE